MSYFSVLKMNWMWYGKFKGNINAMALYYDIY